MNSNDIDEQFYGAKFFWQTQNNNQNGEINLAGARKLDDKPIRRDRQKRI